MNKTAIIFPGQGSQFVGMLSEMAQKFPDQIKDTFLMAKKSLGYDLWAMIQTDESKLNQTEYTQPALLACSFALWNIWQDQTGKCLPAFLAGHSLGEYSALVCGNAISFEDGIRLVSHRGRLMQEAVTEGKGAMAAIIGLSDEAVNKLCQDASCGQILSPANYNAIGQVVISGESEAINRAILLAEQQGAIMAKKISISVPSHCDLMRPAAEKLKNILEGVEIKTPSTPVVFNVDARVHKDPAEIRDALIQQLYSPVRWVQIIQFINSLGTNTMIECGPGRVLAGLNKRIIRQIETLSIDHPDSLLNSLEKKGNHHHEHHAF